MSCAKCAYSAEEVAEVEDTVNSLIADNTKPEKKMAQEKSYIKGEDFLEAATSKGKHKFLTLLEFAYCADPESVTSAYADSGIKIDSKNDLKVLASLYESGNDRKGFRIGSEEQIRKIDVMRIFDTIDIDLNKLAGCGVKFA